MVRSARLEHLMVRSVAQRRVSNHGRPAPLSPVAHPSAFALRATADKSRRRCAPPQDEDERVGWPVCCKQQRIYKAPLMQTPDAFRPPGAIPTVDFLLAHFRAFAKRVPV